MPLEIAGSFLSGSAADERRRKLKRLAETPGINLEDVYDQTFDVSERMLPRAAGLASEANRYSLDDLLASYETAIPGYGKMRGDRASALSSMIQGDIPDDVANAVYRSSVSRGIGSGFGGGSPFTRNMGARDLGLTSLDLMERGSSGLESMIRSTPMPRMQQAGDWLNISPLNTLGLRSGERTQRMNLLADAINAPGSKDIWGTQLQQMGGQLMGGFLGGVGGMGGMAAMAGI